MRFLFFAILLLTSVASHSADFAIPSIKVDGIEPNYLNEGDQFSFTGKQADAFFEALPWVTTTDYDTDSEILNYNRYLVIESNHWALNISCTRPQTFKPGKMSNTTCTVELGVPDVSSDRYEYIPQTSVQAYQNRISVSQINPYTLKEGDEVSFWGGQAEQFMKLLPMSTNGSRELSVVSPAWNIKMSCSKTYNNWMPWLKGLAQTNCSIGLGKN